MVRSAHWTSTQSDASGKKKSPNLARFFFSKQLGSCLEKNSCLSCLEKTAIFSSFSILDLDLLLFLSLSLSGPPAPVPPRRRYLLLLLLLLPRRGQRRHPQRRPEEGPLRRGDGHPRRQRGPVCPGRAFLHVQVRGRGEVWCFPSCSPDLFPFRFSPKLIRCLLFWGKNWKKTRKKYV